jgi:hypothetical protein
VTEQARITELQPQPQKFLKKPVFEAVGLAFSDQLKSPSFSKYDVFQIRRMRFGTQIASQCDSISSTDIAI